MIKARRFLSYAVFSLIDRGLVFLFPLFALYITNSKNIYNEVEFVFSVAGLLSLFMDGGLRIYILYAYKKSGESSLILDRIYAAFGKLLKFYLCVFFIVSVVVLVFYPKSSLDWIAAGSRSLFLITWAFLAVWFRVKDEPEKVYAYSIPLYLAGGFGLWALNSLGDVGIGISIVLPHLFVVGVVVFSERNYPKVRWDDCLGLIKDALQFGWPILLSVVLSMTIANSGRIYAYSSLSVDEMFGFSFAQRIALIVQLTHAVVTGYLSKKLYISDEKDFHVKVFSVYFSVLSLTALAAPLCVVVIRYFGFATPEKLDYTFYMVLGYMVVWCLGAYIEIYINRINKNILILYGNLLSISIFMIFVFVFEYPVLVRITSAMVISALAYATFLFVGIRVVGNKS